MAAALPPDSPLQALRCPICGAPALGYTAPIRGRWRGCGSPSDIAPTVINCSKCFAGIVSRFGPPPAPPMLPTGIPPLSVLRVDEHKPVPVNLGHPRRGESPIGAWSPPPACPICGDTRTAPAVCKAAHEALAKVEQLYPFGMPGHERAGRAVAKISSRADTWPELKLGDEERFRRSLATVNAQLAAWHLLRTKGGAPRRLALPLRARLVLCVLALLLVGAADPELCSTCADAWRQYAGCVCDEAVGIAVGRRVSHTLRTSDAASVGPQLVEAALWAATMAESDRRMAERWGREEEQTTERRYGKSIRASSLDARPPHREQRNATPIFALLGAVIVAAMSIWWVWIVRVARRATRQRPKID